MKAFIFALSLSYCLLASGSASAEPGKVYKWTDGKGVVNYSERPPLGTQTEVVKPDISHSEPVDYGTAASEKPKEQKQVDGAKTALKDPDRCDAARQNLDTLKTYARIRIKGDDGQLRYLTPDEQQQKTNEAAKAIEESCE